MRQPTDLSRPSRRSVIATIALMPLAACATPLGRYGFADAVHRLLQLSTERAFARLTEPGGFYDDQLTRITPPELSGNRAGAVLGALLRTRAVRDRVAMALNDMAVQVADNATPVVLDAVQNMTLTDAAAILRGGPTAATDLLMQQSRGAVVDALLPGVSRTLRSDMFEMLAAALAASGGANYAAMADNVTGQIGDAIFRAIGREEAAIRRDPAATRDPILMALLLGRG